MSKNKANCFALQYGPFRVAKWPVSLSETCRFGLLNGMFCGQRIFLARSRHIVLKHESKWKGQQKRRAEVLFERLPKSEEAYGLSMRLTEISNRKSTSAQARLNLARWCNEVETFGGNEFARVLETFENHNETIINYFEERLTNASVESFNAKAFRTQFRSVGDIRSFMFRLVTQYA